MKNLLTLVCSIIITSCTYASQMVCLTGTQAQQTYNTLKQNNFSQLVIWCSCCNGGKDNKLKMSNCSYNLVQNGACYTLIATGSLNNGSIYKTSLDLLNTYIKVGINAISLAVVMHYNTTQVSSCRNNFLWDEIPENTSVNKSSVNNNNSNNLGTNSRQQYNLFPNGANPPLHQITGIVYDNENPNPEIYNRLLLKDKDGRYYLVIEHRVPSSVQTIVYKNGLLVDWNYIKSGDIIIVNGWQASEQKLEAKQITINSHVDITEKMQKDAISEFRRQSN